jgi:hypothetical protein
LEAQGGDTVFSVVGCDPLVFGETEVNGVDVGFRLLFQQFCNFSGYQGAFQLVSHFWPPANNARRYWVRQIGCELHPTLLPQLQRRLLPDGGG